jgi:hypothetical protein
VSHSLTLPPPPTLPRRALPQVRYFLHTVMYGHPLHQYPAGVVGSLTGEAAHGPSTTASGHARGGGASLIEDLDAGDNGATHMAHIRSLLPPEAVVEAEGLLKAGLARFKKSSLLHIFAARFYFVYRANVHLQMRCAPGRDGAGALMCQLSYATRPQPVAHSCASVCVCSHLMQAERRNPGLDLAYLIFQARKAAEDSSGSRGQMSAVIRVSFEKYLTDARK